MRIRHGVLVAAVVLVLIPTPARADPGDPAGAAVDPAGRVYFTTGTTDRPFFVPDGAAPADSLMRAGPRGRLTTVATFAPRIVPFPAGLPFGPRPGTPVTMRSVPDAVVRGPDGAFYVGERTGFPYLPGQARVWRVVPGRRPTVYATGFTRIVGLAWSADGRLRVREAGSGR